MLAVLVALPASIAWSAADPAVPAVVVTATRTPSRISDVVADVTVIDRAQIQAAKGLSTAALLSRVPGIQISSNGGIGAGSSVFIRGGEARHTLLLVDGVRMGSATAGTPSLENLPLDQIERIEIVRGPLAALYGADAAAGVIQVFTRRGKDGLRFNASASVGTEDYRALTAGVSGGAGALTYSVQASTQATAGFNATTPKVSSNNHNPDRDGFSQRALSLNAAYAFMPGWMLEGHVLRSEAINELDDGVRSGGRSTPETERANLAEVQSLKLNGRPTGDWRTGLTWSRSVDRGETKVANKASSLSMIQTVQEQWAWEQQIATRLGMALFSLEQLHQAISHSVTVYPVRSRTMRAVVLGLSGEQGPHVWQMSARRDWNSQFGQETTGSAAYGFDVMPKWRAGASVGTSFVAPTFNQLYSPNFGDATLQPERGTSRELSLRWQDGGDLVKLVRFDNRVTNLIQAAGSPQRAMSTPYVAMTGWTWSAEMTRDTGFGSLHLAGALDVLDARVPDTGKKLKQRADTALTLNADLTRGAWRYGAYAKASDGAFGDDANTNANRLAGFTLLGLSADWGFEPGWKLSFKVDNLSDKDIQTVHGYHQPRRQFVVGIGYTGR